MRQSKRVWGGEDARKYDASTLLHTIYCSSLCLAKWHFCTRHRFHAVIVWTRLGGRCSCECVRRQIYIHILFSLFSKCVRAIDGSWTKMVRARLEAPIFFGEHFSFIYLRRQCSVRFANAFACVFCYLHRIARPVAVNTSELRQCRFAYLPISVFHSNQR